MCVCVGGGGGGRVHDVLGGCLCGGVRVWEEQRGGGEGVCVCGEGGGGLKVCRGV